MRSVLSILLVMFVALSCVEAWCPSVRRPVSTHFVSSSTNNRPSSTSLNIFLDEMKPEPIVLLSTFEATADVDNALDSTAKLLEENDPFWFDEDENWAQAKRDFPILVPYSNQDLRREYLLKQQQQSADLLLSPDVLVETALGPAVLLVFLFAMAEVFLLG